MEPEVVTGRSCLLVQKVSFGLGHIFNDLCAAMWFSYTLFYLQVVLTMESATAGILLMLGQVVDSLATPLAGWAIDYTGHRRLWHLGGTVAVSIGFPLIFSLKPSSFTTEIIPYYVAAITVFQTGWAIVQISHLSLIPEISTNHSHSTDLTTIRYTASVCCSISVYFITLIMLKNDGNEESESESIGPNDFYKFKGVALIITFIGLLSSMLFYCGLLGTQENEYEVIRGAEVDDVNNLNTHDREKHFLKSLLIYGVSLMCVALENTECTLHNMNFFKYMASRLFTILNLIYIPLYIDERGELVEDKARMRQTIASVPLTSYIASFLTSLILKFRKGICNDKITYLCGSLFGLSASIWIGIGLSVSSDTELYVIAVLLGISGSSSMVASLCLTVNFVKANGYGGGRVYSMVTFTDKLISGGVVLLVQNLQCTPRTKCPNFYENVLSYICGLVSAVGLLSLALLEHQIRNINRRN